MHHKVFRIHTHTGEWVLDQAKIPPNPEKPMYNGHRADFHRVIYKYALSLGIPIHLGKRVASYHEDDKQMKAWVTTDEGEIFKGDVVVGADGVRSRARKLVLGYDDKPKSSGYAVYRAWFDAEKAGIAEDPLTREFVANGDTHTGCVSPHLFFIFFSFFIFFFFARYFFFQPLTPPLQGWGLTFIFWWQRAREGMQFHGFAPTE